MADPKEKETPKKPNPPEEKKQDELKNEDLDKASGGFYSKY
jgi:hypothetical protein